MGFASAGFRVTHGADIAQAAANTASYNLHWRHGHDTEHLCMDLTCASGRDVCERTGDAGCIVIGGPPCQAYSNIGIPKLRSLGEARKNTNDRRGRLYEDFVRLATELNARAVVMENVPDAVSYGGQNIPHTVCDLLKENGYDAFWTLLNAADYGVPQVRERVFVIGVRQNEHRTVKLPLPTHTGPEGWNTQNDVKFRAFEKLEDYRPKPTSGAREQWRTVSDALSDLPSLFPTASTKYILHEMSTRLPYEADPANPYQDMMRSWYGRHTQSVTANCFRRTNRDFPIFERMEQGDKYLAAVDIAEQLLREECASAHVAMEPGNKDYEALKKAIVPPYNRENFRSKWQRLAMNLPSHTLPAHLAVDTYSHIHPTEPRGISVREAARLQSFPDDFVFQCSMGDAFRQIGNAVPPLLAKAVAAEIRKAFTS